jgi:hypothetical protein
MRQHNIEMNWRVRPIRSPKVLKGHDEHVITCLQFNDNKIVSGSDDNTLKVNEQLSFDDGLGPSSSASKKITFSTFCHDIF